MKYSTNAKLPIPECRVCGKIIKGKPTIFDDYYFCSDFDDCLKFYCSK